jgi:hypothetical protein
MILLRKLLQFLTKLIIYDVLKAHKMCNKWMKCRDEMYMFNEIIEIFDLKRSFSTRWQKQNTKNTTNYKKHKRLERNCALDGKLKCCID